MSVINTMLKNIAEREARAPATQTQSVAVAPVADYRSGMIKAAMVVLALLLIALAYLYLPAPAQHEQVATKTNVAMPVGVAQQSPEAVAPVDPLIDEVIIQEQVISTPVTQVNSQPTFNDLTEAQIAQLDTQVLVTEDTVFIDKVTAPIAVKNNLSTAPAPATAEPVEILIAAPKQAVKQESVSSKPVKQKARQVTIAQQIAQAKQNLEYGLYGDAIDTLIEVLAGTPEQQQARTLLAVTYIQQQQGLLAQQVLFTGIQIIPEQLSWRVMLSKLLINQQDYQSVLALLKPDFSAQAGFEFWLLRGTAAQNLAQHEAAITSFSELTKLQPQQAKWWLAQATSNDAIGQYGEAIRLYKVALNLGGLSSGMTQHAMQRLVVLQEGV